MLEASLQGLSMIANPTYLVMLLIGVLLGLLVGVLPAIGTTFGLALLLPFMFRFDAASGIALMIGLAATAPTADSISSILIGVPGSGLSVASVLDGYPMARRGEAMRALSAAFFCSIVGGVIGAILLMATIPVARPLLNIFGSPEFFMLSMLGITLASVLTGRRPLKGIVAGVLGMLLASVGPVPGNPFVRFAFDVQYLYSGLPMVVVALGIFGVPEIIDLMIGDKPIAGNYRLTKGTIAGIKDCLKNWWLMLRASVIGAFVSFLPGLGADVSAWLAYGHAVQSAKDKGNFGKGDVRGVIAPETANNSARGGQLIPVLFFGIPGSTPMAMFMMGLMVFGVYAGPSMMNEQLPLVFWVAWGLAIATVIGGVVCILLARPLAQLSRAPIHIVAPFILMLLVIGAYQESQSWGDIIFLFSVGALGWVLKRFEFSRPAFLIGFILGAIAEKYFYISVTRFGPVGWLSRPAVIVIAIAIVFSLYVGVRRQLRGAPKEPMPGGGS